MKYALTVTVNLPDDEREGHFVENGYLIGDSIDEIMKRFPNATSLVLTIVPQREAVAQTE